MIICCLSFSLMASAQASGGQIRRPVNKQSTISYRSNMSRRNDNRLKTSEVSKNEKHSIFVEELLKDFIYMDKGTISNKTINPFWISKILVSQKLWKEIMGNNPSSAKSETAPVDKISWYECQKFIEKLNKKTGLSFRMPTSDEWAYASTRGIQGKIGEWTTSPHCYSDNNGYGRYSITRILPYTNYTEATRALTIKEKDLGLRLALDKR